MNREKIVVMTPLLAPPNPRDIEVLKPMTRQVMNALEKQYSDIIIACGNNDNDYAHLLPSNLRLSPIPCLENSDQWNDIQLTIDTGSRRNQKLIDKSNRNMEQILGKVREKTADLNLNETNYNNAESKEGQNKTTTKKDKEKLDLKQFEFTEKKKVVRINETTRDQNQINRQNGDVTNKFNNDDGMNSNKNQVQETASKKDSSSKVRLEQFAFKPRPKNTNALDESNKSNEAICANIINKPVTVNLCAQSDKVDEITFDYVPSDDSSNMSFSQKSVEFNFNPKSANVVIDDTPCNPVSAVALLAKNYSDQQMKQDVKRGNNRIQIDETPQNEQKSALELLADEYNGRKPTVQSAIENNCSHLVRNECENMIVDETPQIQESRLEILVHKHSEHHYTYGDYTLVIENVDQNKPVLIIDETPANRQTSALELLAQKYNESGSVQLDSRSENKQTAVEQVSNDKHGHPKVDLTTNEEITFDYSSSMSLATKNATVPLKIVQRKDSTFDLYNNGTSGKSNISAQNQKTPVQDNNGTLIRNVNEKLPNTCSENVAQKTFLNESNKVQNVSKQVNEQDIIAETPNCNRVSALELLAEKYNDSASAKCTQNGENQNATSGNGEQNTKANTQIILAQNAPDKQVSHSQIHTQINNVQVQSSHAKQTTNNLTQGITEKYDEDDLLDKSVSQNKFCNINNEKKVVADENLETNTKNTGTENKTDIVVDDKDCLNQNIAQNKIEYIENWLRNLADHNLNTTETEQYDEFMDVEPTVDETNSLRNTDEKTEENKENIPPKSSTGDLKSNIVNPSTNIENKCKIDTPTAARSNHQTQNENSNQIENGTDYVEDWFKDMPEEYSKIKDLFDFDMSTSTDRKSLKCAPEMKPKPLLPPPEPVRKPRKTKVIQRKTYMLEIDKSKPVPQPKRVQTKITSIFQPINVDIRKQQQPQHSAKDERENKMVDNKAAKNMAGKRKISDHFKVLKPRAKKARIDAKEDESKPENQAPKFIRKRVKYFTPILSQLPEKEVKYEMYTVDDNMASQMEVYIKENVPDEISFNIIYRNGFCRLSQPKKTLNIEQTASGIMLRVSWLTEKLTKSYFTEFYHIHLTETYWHDFAIARSLVQTCLTLHCRKISFKAQSLFVLLMDTFSFTAEEVSLQWIVLDPYIGCWLLDPDHPPTTFQGVQSQLDTRPKYKVTACDVAVRSCDMLIQLSQATQRLQSRLEERDLWTIFIDMEMRIVSILSVMEHRGICTNVNVLKSFSKTLKDKSNAVENEAYKIAGKQFQLNSPVQVRAILYDELKLDSANCIEIKQTATLGAKSTSEPMLQLLRKVHPLPGLILEYRHLNKAKSTYVDAMLQRVTNGIIKSTWEQTAAATGRIASCNPNLQTIPKHPFPLVLFPETGDLRGEDTLQLRNAYSARPGYSLLAADFQHIELRVFAHLACDQSITDALNGPGDIFMQMTKCWLGNKVTPITDEHRERTKKIVYSTIYGAGAGKLADILSVPQDEAAAILRDFTKKFPSLREFSTTTIEQCRIQGYLTSLSGRCRLFPDINSAVFGLKAQSERQAVNFLIQGSAADICKAAMISTEEKLKHLDCKLLLQIHDELVWEVTESELNQVKSIVKHVMEDTSTMCGKLIKLSVPLPVSISVGKSWGDMK